MNKCDKNLIAGNLKIYQIIWMKQICENSVRACKSKEIYDKYDLKQAVKDVNRETWQTDLIPVFVSLFKWPITLIFLWRRQLHSKRVISSESCLTSWWHELTSYWVRLLTSIEYFEYKRCLNDTINFSNYIRFVKSMCFSRWSHSKNQDCFDSMKFVIRLSRQINLVRRPVSPTIKNVVTVVRCFMRHSRIIENKLKNQINKYARVSKWRWSLIKQLLNS